MTDKKMDALEKGVEMMSVPMNKLPQLAQDYAKHLCGRVGMCMEVLLSAWSSYAEVVLGLDKSSDSLYHAPPEAYAWFAENKQTGEKNDS